MPFQLFLAVLLFSFTLSFGLVVLSDAKKSEEKASGYKTVNTLVIKANIVLNGAPGSKEKVDFTLYDSKIRLYNENAYGVIKAEFSDGTEYVETLPVPFAQEEYFLPGEHSVFLVHMRKNRSYIAVERCSFSG